jgi:hypothetical protein
LGTPQLCATSGGHPDNTGVAWLHLRVCCFLLRQGGTWLFRKVGETPRHNRTLPGQLIWLLECASLVRTRADLGPCMNKGPLHAMCCASQRAFGWCVKSRRAAVPLPAHTGVHAGTGTRHLIVTNSICGGGACTCIWAGAGANMLFVVRACWSGAGLWWGPLCSRWCQFAWGCRCAALGSCYEGSK